MRSEDTRQELMLLGLTADDLIPANHPLRCMKPIVERALAALSPTFATIYAPVGRKSIQPGTCSRQAC